MTDLSDFYAPEDPPQTDEERERWQVTSDGQAQWCLLRLARAEQQLARINEAATEMIRHATEWRDRESRQHQRDADFFRGAAADYHRRRLQPVVDDITADGVVDKEAWKKVKGKRYPLPAGHLEAKRSQDKVVIEDPDALVSWALADWATRTLLNISPSLSAIKLLPRTADGRVGTEDGEIVPGVRVEGGTVSFDAKATTTDEVPAWLPGEGTE